MSAPEPFAWFVLGKIKLRRATKLQSRLDNVYG